MKGGGGERNCWLFPSSSDWCEESGYSLFLPSHLTPHYSTSHTYTNPHPGTPSPEKHFSQGALNSLALFDLGRSGVSVRYKPTVNHE